MIWIRKILKQQDALIHDLEELKRKGAADCVAVFFKQTAEDAAICLRF